MRVTPEERNHGVKILPTIIPSGIIQLLITLMTIINYINNSQWKNKKAESRNEFSKGLHEVAVTLKTTQIQQSG